MGLHDIYLELAPEHIAYVKFIFESYEEIGIIRTVDRDRAIVVLLAMSDFVDVARQILASIQNDLPVQSPAGPNRAPLKPDSIAFAKADCKAGRSGYAQ
jgi:hypothetical protein